MIGHDGSTLGAERKIGNAWAAVCVRKGWKRKYYLRHIYTCGCLKKEIYTLSEIVCYFGCWRARISRPQPNTAKIWHNNNNYNYVTRCMIIVK